MLNYFMAGPDLVRWELATVAQRRPYRLTIHHALGTITEYFDDVTSALVRQRELEQLLVAARADTSLTPNSSWAEVPLAERKQA